MGSAGWSPAPRAAGVAGDDPSRDGVMSSIDKRAEAGEVSEATASSELLRRARRGESSAVEALFARWFPWLRRRSRGRLPRWARGAADTSDVVQDVVLHTLRRIAGFESTSGAAFRAYLLRAVDHRIRDEMRRVGRRGTPAELDAETLPAADMPSPLQQAIDAEAWGRYVRALGRLTERERRLVVGRGELGYSFAQLALVDDRASAEAARKALRRALVRLSAEMDA